MSTHIESTTKKAKEHGMDEKHWDTDNSSSISCNLKQALNFEEKLLDLPEIRDFINSLKKQIEKQERKIRKLKVKIKDYKSKRRKSDSVGTQTDEFFNATEDSAPKSLVDDITEAATNAVQESGFAYEATSGLYYDYNTGYYYNAEYGLYYDGNTGIYYKYDEQTKEFTFHSQVALPSSRSGSETKTKRKAPIPKCHREEAKRAKPEADVPKTTEEGECTDSDSDSNHSTRLNNLSDESDVGGKEISKAWPPCMRIVVQESKLEKLRVGTLFIITCDGGSMGREGDHAMLIPDIAVSKHHASFSFDRDKSKYHIIDLGSRNGTFLNGKRMSVAKQESEAMDLVHGSIIQVGTTKLLCHIHPGHETCGHCEPGLLQVPVQVAGKVEISAPPTTRNYQHKNELKRLRKKFGIDGAGQGEVSLADGYSDRAQHRRETVGSLDHNAKTEAASIDQSITSNNKGFKLLKGMGWTEGQSLGKDGSGATEPIPLKANPGKSGLGNAECLPLPALTAAAKRREDVWRRTQERYKNLPDEAAPPADMADIAAELHEDA